MVVLFSKHFMKELRKHLAKAQAKELVKKLSRTTPSDGDFIALVAHIVIREKKLRSFRFYFIVAQEKTHVITHEELKDFIIKFVALSKKNNQQEVIDQLKADLKNSGFEF